MSKNILEKERKTSLKARVATHLLTSTLALSILLNSGGSVAAPALAQGGGRLALVGRSDPNSEAPKQDDNSVVLDASSGSATWSSEGNMPRPFPIKPGWGILEEVYERAEIDKLTLPQPQVGGFSESIYDGPGLLSDGISSSGTNKAWKLHTKEGSLPVGTKIDDLAVQFPKTTETVGIELESTPDGLIIRQKYNPGETGAYPRIQEFRVKNIDQLKPVIFTATYANFGSVRSWIIENGTRSFQDRPDLHRDSFAKVK